LYGAFKLLFSYFEGAATKATNAIAPVKTSKASGDFQVGC